MAAALTVAMGPLDGTTAALAQVQAVQANEAPGRVTGQILDALQRPIAGARVHLEDIEGKIVAQGITGDDGRFALRDVPPGTYSLVAERTNFHTGTAVVSVRGGADTPSNLSLASTSQLNLNLVAQQLDQARNGLSPDVGASIYHFDQQSIQQLPQGSNTPLNQVLLRAPGVAQDSAASGSLHVRGEHANLQYRLNGILLPEGISGFGQLIDTRVIGSLELITGTLPAQYGFRTAGVVDIQTKAGAFDKNAGAATVYGGSHNTLEPSIDYSGSLGSLSYFASGSYRMTGLGIENPTSSSNPLHDELHEYKGFGYVSYLFPNLTSRTSLIVGTAYSTFQIPNRPGVAPVNTLPGGQTVASANLDQNQTERNQFGIAAFQDSTGKVDYQVAYSVRNSTLTYNPDPIGDLIYNGFEPNLVRTSLNNALQADASYPIGETHTLRSGFFVSNEHTSSDNQAFVFFGDAGAQTTPGDSPFQVQDNNSITGWLYGLYLQDEWKITPRWTLNYGARADADYVFRAESQLSPRINTVYDLTPLTAVHAGYARTFTPPPLEIVSASTLSAFTGTTGGNSGNGQTNTSPFAERSSVYDLGITQKITPEIQVGLDAYYKQVRHLLDEGQFGVPVVLTPFNYEDGKIKGVEFSSSYTTPKLSGYLNFAVSRALGRDIISGQSTFAQSDLNYIQGNWIHLDHDQMYSGSAGVSYAVTDSLRANVDMFYGSGLRRTVNNPNDSKLTPYTQVNLGAVQHVSAPAIGDFDVRLAVINLLDNSYQIRDGTGIGVGAPQFGPRRAYYAGVTKYF
jgi:outer membrane receptor protein involved in Fe transport